MQACASALNDLCLQARDPNQEQRLRAGFRAGHQRLAAAWLLVSAGHYWGLFLLNEVELGCVALDRSVEGASGLATSV